MSKLKRQRLTLDGQDQVTASSNEALAIDEAENVQHSKNKKQQGRSLFVRSLPATATSESLANFFSQSFPLKHATVVSDPSTQESKGYGFVTFADVEDAQCAKDAFNGSLFEGRKIKVELAEPRHRQTDKDGHAVATKTKTAPGRQKPEILPPPKLIVRNLPWTIKEPEHLAQLFRSYGKVIHATLPKKKPGLSTGFGFVVLRGRKNAQKALVGVNGKEIEGRTLAVDWAVDKEFWEKSHAGSKEIGEGHITNDSQAAKDNRSVKSEENEGVHVDDEPQSDIERENTSDSEDGRNESPEDQDNDDGAPPPQGLGNNTSTLFIRNLPFSSTDEKLKKHFDPFGPVRYARVVLDLVTERSKGTGFVCFYRQEDAGTCLREAPKSQTTPGQAATASKSASGFSNKQSLLEDTSLDRSGQYTYEGRVLQISRAVERDEAARLTFASNNIRDAREKDRRRLYLLSEGTVPSNTPLYDQLSASEIQMREDSSKQRQALIRTNPTLHLSLTRLSVRNLPRSITSKDLKALSREAVVGFAKDVKARLRGQLSKEELSRGGEEMKEAEKTRKAKGKGIVKQAKIVFEGREGGKVAEDSGAGRSRGYGFIEYSSHRWALMGLRWLNGHALGPSKNTSGFEGQERRKRLIVEFAIENAQVVSRRHEREAKARERSKFVSKKREKGEFPAPIPKPFTRDHLMAKTRRGMKRKQALGAGVSELATTAPTSNNTPVTEEKEYDKLGKRQKIIGRKRMMRRAKSRAASS
ncbi:RNA recognition motif-containing protein [Mycoblastus sanguinarius]|nr:RNA recognition motif-containing protein [Mycoblastus sanguinarius]